MRFRAFLCAWGSTNAPVIDAQEQHLIMIHLDKVSVSMTRCGTSSVRSFDCSLGFCPRNDEDPVCSRYVSRQNRAGTMTSIVSVQL